MKPVCLTLVLLVCVLILSACENISRLSNGLDRQLERNTEEAISKSPALQEVDKVCREVPLPSDFVFVRKGGLDDQKITLSYYYSSKTKYEEAQGLWRNYFEGTGWRLIKVSDFPSKSMEFRNETYRISTFYGGMGSGVDYSIYCEKL